MTLTFNDRCFHHIETSQLICRASQLFGFYMVGTLVVERLKTLKKLLELEIMYQNAIYIFIFK